MKENLQQVKHDFINHSLRLEVLFRLVGEQLQSGASITPEYLEDLEISLTEMQQFVLMLKK